MMLPRSVSIPRSPQPSHPRSSPRTSVPRRMRVAGTVLALLLGGAATGHARPSAPPAAARSVSFRLPTRDGWVASDSLRGKVVLVDFWASWCTPCRQSFPWLASMQERYGPSGFVVVAINLDKERAAAERFLERVPAPFTVAFDPTGQVAESLHVSAMPSSFVIGRSGGILLSHAGFDPAKTAEVEARIAEACRP